MYIHNRNSKYLLFRSINPSGCSWKASSPSAIAVSSLVPPYPVNKGNNYEDIERTSNTYYFKMFQA
jgi:hypothetical protein